MIDVTRDLYHTKLREEQALEAAAKAKAAAAAVSAKFGIAPSPTLKGTSYRVALRFVG